MIVLNDIDYENPVVKYIEDRREKTVEKLRGELPLSQVKVIKSVTYKVSQKKKPYARINFVGEKGFSKSRLCFKLTPDIFIAGEILVFKDPKPPFLTIERRIK